MVISLGTRLTEAVAAAIANEHASLESPVGHVRGVMIELVLTSTHGTGRQVAPPSRQAAMRQIVSRMTGTQAGVSHAACARPRAPATLQPRRTR